MPEKQDGPILEVSGLTKRYGGFRAVDDLSFRVFAGDVFGFLGQNGAGKSTTIRMLLTLIRPTAGSIRVFGMDLFANRRSVLSRVGAVIEKPDLYGYLTGRENLSIFARLGGRGVARMRIDETLALVGLTDRAGDAVRTYSQGMRQRLGIACALVNDPDLVVLDEPTNGLDPQGIADMRSLILRLSREEGKTFLISSHLLVEMELIANRMLIIDHGRKVVEGEVKALLEPEKVMLQVETADDGAARAAVAAGPWAACLRPSGEGVTLHLPRESAASLVRWLVEAGIEVSTVKPVDTLEAYFLSLTKAVGHVDAGAH